MTLAVLFLLSAFWITSSPFVGQIAAHQPASASSTSPSETPAQEGSSGTNSTNSQPSSPSSPAQTPSASKSAPSKTRTSKKKPASQDCSASPAPLAPGAEASQPANQPSSDPPPTAGEASAAKPASPKSCPPPKIIVRQGGSTEPHIQLAGGPTAAEAARKRDAVSQLLGATDQNLKKTAGWQLNSSQQDTITQTRQFVKQSEAAMAEGDLERARTLAWKAELLSEDLINPQK
jgi:hypothetical protein